MTDKPRRDAGRKAKAATPVKPVLQPSETVLAAPEPTTAPEPAPVSISETQAPVMAADLPVPAAAAEPVIEAETVMTDANKINDQFQANAQDTASKAQATVADMNARAQNAMERSARFVEDFNDFSKGNIEALVESSKAAARHAEAMSQQAAEFGRKSYEQASAAVKEMTAVKSPTDLFRLQSDYARQAFDQMVSETSRNSEAMLKAAGDVFQPLSNRFAVAADKLKVDA